MDPNANGLAYHTVAERVMDDARRQGLQAGARLPSVRELAGRYLVAKATIQLALRELQSEGLCYTVNRRGVFLAKDPPPHAAPTTAIGLVLNYERYSEENNPFYRSLYEGAEAEVAAHKHNLLSLHEWSKKDPLQKNREIAQFRGQLAGFLALGIYDERDCLRLRESGVPLVAVDYETLDLGIDCVVIDNHRVAHELARTVAERTPGRLFYADLARASEYDPAQVDRRRAFEDVLSATGRPSRPDDLILLSGGLGTPTGCRALSAEVEKGGPQPAVICSDESAARCLVDELGDKGPQAGKEFQLAYLGFLEPQHPRMRALPALIGAIDFGEFGREGVRLLEERIALGSGRAIRRTICGELVEWHGGTV